MSYVGLLAMLLLSTDTLAIERTPTHILVVGNGQRGAKSKEIFHVGPDGHIMLGPGASLDDAFLAFWKVIDHGKCRQESGTRIIH